jgi:predicted HTH transcriptional regulator
MEKLFRNNGNQSLGVEQKKVVHKKQILRTLYFFGTMSNSELSKIIKLSTPKINSLLVELIEDGLVKEGDQIFTGWLKMDFMWLELQST